MSDLPFSYQKIDSSTWAYLSSLLLIALFFKFNRFWSIRNLDLLLIVLLAPGLLMIESGRYQTAQSIRNSASVETSSATLDLGASNTPTVIDDINRIASSDLPVTTGNATVPGFAWQLSGFIWLFSVGLLLLIRLLMDPGLTRRPVLEPNLSQGGLFFFAGSLFLILTANVILSEPTSADLEGAKNAIKLLQREVAEPVDVQQLRQRGPGLQLFFVFPIMSTFDNGGEILQTDADELENIGRYIVAAKILAIVTQSLIVIGLILFCYRNFDNLSVGVGTAAIYLMLPYTAMHTVNVMHTLPATLVLWAAVCFRIPWLAGLLIGLATGVAYYPLFLLPLWASFYWERGWKKFLMLVVTGIVICVIGGSILTSVDSAGFIAQLQSMFGFWYPRMDNLQGIWALGWSSWWRLPILVTFVALCFSFIGWPTEKNLGTLISYTAAIMVAVQFWHALDGGLHMAWYLPLLLLVIFRPNMSGRVASLEIANAPGKQIDVA